MTPLPKKKLSKGRRDRRRAHDALNCPEFICLQQLWRIKTASYCLPQVRFL